MWSSQTSEARAHAVAVGKPARHRNLGWVPGNPPPEPGDAPKDADEAQLIRMTSRLSG
jgi:hypothetical protein